jgi:adenylyltransferase/sulfurtransferase
VEPLVTDVNPSNIEQLITDVDLVLDGTDNLETRFLINDACLKMNIPWIYGGVIGMSGMTMNVIPHQTPCFRCLLNEIPVPGSVPTCETEGVLGSAAALIAALECTECIKLLTGQVEACRMPLLSVDIWEGRFDRLNVAKGDAPCIACDLEQYEFLESRRGSKILTLCGRDAVQITLKQSAQVSFHSLAERLHRVGSVSFNDYMFRLNVDPYEFTIFPDGRTIIRGCTDPSLARTLFAKFIGL